MALPPVIQNNQTLDNHQVRPKTHLPPGGDNVVDGVCLETETILPPPWQKFPKVKRHDHNPCPQLQTKKRKRNFLDDDPTIIHAMNHRTGPPKLDLRLNLSPPRPQHHDHRRLSLESDSTNPSSSEYSISPPTSCLSSELSAQEEPVVHQQQQLVVEDDDDGPTAGSSSMVLVGCPRCLMYVMLSEDDPKCPKCKSSVLLDFIGAAAGGGLGAVKTSRAAVPVNTTGVAGYCGRMIRK